MLLVKLTTLKKLRLSALYRLPAVIILLYANALQAQDNSPYSRYGLGDKVPSTNVANRGMGGIAAAYNDFYTINYANPASYSYFQTFPMVNSRKISGGRALFNIGAEGQGRTLIDPNSQNRFTATNIYFSNVLIGMPIRKNWGIAMGLRPLSSINYKIQNNYPSRQGVDSSSTLYQGEGGVYLGSIGTGVKIKTGASSYFSVGANAGYMFGKKDYSTRVSLYNDSTFYENGNVQNKAGLNGFYFDAGVQYHFKLNDDMLMSLGAYGNWQQKINTYRDYIAETYTYDETVGYRTKDTVAIQSDIKGTMIYPSSITGGFAIQKPARASNESSWMVGADFTNTSWNQYRFEGRADTAVKNSWQAKVGAEFRPAGKKSYLSNVAYRVGFHTGPDYIYARKTSLPVIGISGGLGLPLANFSQQAKGQASMINLSFEYIKRGNNDNLLKENLYRLSVGFSLTDIWFGGKTKYLD